MEDLVTSTNEVLYEHYRTAKLLATGSGTAPGYAARPVPPPFVRARV